MFIYKLPGIYEECLVHCVQNTICFTNLMVNLMIKELQLLMLFLITSEAEPEVHLFILYS